jgi:hypothetical protein
VRENQIFHRRIDRAHANVVVSLAGAFHKVNGACQQLIIYSRDRMYSWTTTLLVLYMAWFVNHHVTAVV